MVIVDVEDGPLEIQILFLGLASEDPDADHPLLIHICSALSIDLTQVRIENMNNTEDLANYISTNECPHIVVASPKFSSAENLKKIFQTLKQLDNGCCNLLISDMAAKSETLMDWFDHGLTGVVSDDWDNISIEDQLKDTLQNRVSSHVLRIPRVPCEVDVRLKYESSTKDVKAKTVNISLGGTFLHPPPENLNVGDLFDIEFLFPENSLHAKGRIIWIRKTPLRDQEPGIGVQFTDLEEVDLEKIKSIISKRKKELFTF